MGPCAGPAWYKPQASAPTGDPGAAHSGHKAQAAPAVHAGAANAQASHESAVTVEPSDSTTLLHSDQSACLPSVCSETRSLNFSISSVLCLCGYILETHTNTAVWFLTVQLCNRCHPPLRTMLQHLTCIEYLQGWLYSSSIRALVMAPSLSLR